MRCDAVLPERGVVKFEPIILRGRPINHSHFSEIMKAKWVFVELSSLGSIRYLQEDYL